MEILEQTLRELESRERNQHNLETTYVKDLLPGFRDEFKSFGIQDLDNYGTYSLQNILDDLRHIQMLLDGSPTIQKFKDKKEFLLELSRKMLRKVQKVANVPEVQSEKEIRSTESIKDPKEKEGGKKEQEIQLPIIRRKKPVKINKNTEFQMTKTQDKVAEAISEQQPAQDENSQHGKSQGTGEAKVDSPSLIKLKVVPKKKEEPAKEDKKQGNITIEEMEPSEIKEDKQEVKEDHEAKEIKEKQNKEVRVKKIHKSHKSSKEEGKRKKQEAVEGQEKLSQIAEEVDGSDNEGTETNDTESRRVKKKWQLTEDQEKQIQEMSAQYGVEVDALRGYLESKAAQHHFNWLGIKRLETKVDMNLEIKKLESEYERFVQRKSYFRSDYPYKNKMSSSQMLPAVFSRGGKRHSDQFAIIDSADKSTSRAASNSGFRSAAEKFQFDLKDMPTMKRKSMMTHSQSLPNSREKPSRGEDGPSSDEYWSTVSFVKSKGQIKLPSITSFNPYSKKAIPSQTTINFDFDEDFSKRTELNSLTGIHHLTNAELYNVLVSPTFKGRNSQKFFGTPANGRQLPAVPILADHFSFNKIDTRASLDDSLAMEIENKDRRGASNGFTGLKLNRKFSSNDKTPVSQIHTSRSKYIHSSQSAYKSNAESLTFDDLPPLNMKGVKSDSNQTEQEFKAKGELLRMDSELGSISRGDSNGNREESMGIGTTLQTISTKSVVSVYTQEAPSRFMSLASFNSGMRIVEGELEYYGTINRTQLLGIGSEAKVYLCHMKEYENDVALKQYKGMKKGPESMQVYDTIKDEFMMLRRLEHENIIKYHCLYRSNRKNNLLEFGVIMEYMQGGSLEDYIKKEYASIPFEQKKLLMKQILEGLNYLHKNDIIHRDLKPENILLSQDKTVAKITDFGISTQNKHDMNIERSVVGTPWYMAPEIIKLEAYSAKADIWSAGCCFYQLILGMKPYHQESAAIAMERMAKSLTPLQDNVDEIETHKGLKEILELCFTRDKDSRPTAEELLEHPFFAED